MARRAGRDRVIEFPYLVMFRNENGHFVSVGGGSEFKTEKEATAKAKEKCDVNVCFWPLADITVAPTNVGFGGKSRHCD